MGLIVHVDGGSRGNPGPSGAGVTISSEDGTLVHEGAYFLGRQTNNAAEYHALIRGLQRVERCDEQTVTVCSDSELLVRQITGEYRVKSPRLARLFQQAQLLLLKISSWHVRHVPREENQRADELANLAMDAQRDMVVFDVEAADNDEPGRPTGAAADPRDAPAQAPAPREPEPPAQAVTEKTTEDADRNDLGTRVTRVAVVRAPKPDGCPAGGCPSEPFTIGDTLPAGLCTHAAHALLPTVLAILNTQPEEFAAVPTLTVRCMRPECGATFHVSPARSTNGKAKRENPT